MIRRNVHAIIRNEVIILKFHELSNDLWSISYGFDRLNCRHFIYYQKLRKIWFRHSHISKYLESVLLSP